MKILAYDTSSDVLSAAIFDDEQKIAEMESRSYARHSSVLVPSLERLLKDHGIDLEEIGLIAVGLGPGSFTGLRVGLAAAKIFGYILKIKIVGVSSLEAIAWEAKDFEGEIAVILDAKKEKLYAGVFIFKDHKLRIVKRPGLFGIDALLKGVRSPRIFLGNGAEIYRESILKSKHCRIAVNAASVYPRAAHIARQAMEFVRRKEFSDPFSMKPLYLHPKDCNVTLSPKRRVKR